MKLASHKHPEPIFGWQGGPAYPVTHLGWHAYYAKRFNKTQHPDAEHLALYYLMLALRDGEA